MAHALSLADFRSVKKRKEEKVPPPQRLLKREKYITPEEFQRLLDAARADPRAWLIFWFLGNSGLRIVELERMIASDVPAQGTVIKVRTAKQRSEADVIDEIELPEAVIVRLRDWIKGLGLGPDAKVFGFTRRVTRGWLNRYSREAGIRVPGRGFHAFRHMNCMMLLDAGALPHVAQLHLRHRSPTQIIVYSHTMRYREAIEKVGVIGK